MKGRLYGQNDHNAILSIFDVLSSHQEPNRRKVTDDPISNVQKRSGNVSHLIAESHWKNGIMMLIGVCYVMGTAKIRILGKFINAYKKCKQSFVGKGIFTDQGELGRVLLLSQKVSPVG